MLGYNRYNMKVRSPDFENNSMLPPFTAYHDSNRNPILIIEYIPPNTKSLALIMDDPDAPMGTWVHWVVWNIPPVNKIESGRLPEGSVVGVNSWGKNEYGGPAPPSGTHRYFFKIYALDIMLNLDKSSTKAELEKAMQGHIIDKAEIVGLYGH